MTQLSFVLASALLLAPALGGCVVKPPVCYVDYQHSRLLPKMVLGEMHSAALDPEGAGQRRRAAAGLPPMTVDDVYELFDKMPVLCGWSPAVFGGYPDRPRDQIVEGTGR